MSFWLRRSNVYGAEFSRQLSILTLIRHTLAFHSAWLLLMQMAKTKTGKSIDSVAPLTSTIGFGVERDNFGSALNVKMVASKDDWNSDDNVDVSGYTVVDLTAYYRPITDLTLRAMVY
ncbi:TonB-dependent receptor [Vibrio chagasii]|nr:TonB-dependent receptor [Vibrio chagasii]